MDDTAFSAVDPSSAVYDTLQPLRDLIAGDPALAIDAGASVRAEVLPRRTRDGGWELRRCYWSVVGDGLGAAERVSRRG